MPLFPPWREFVDKSAEAQISLDAAVKRSGRNDAMLKRGIEVALDVLPHPLNQVARVVYLKSDGSVVQKASDVTYYLKYLQRLGWSHYENITGQLGSLLNATENKEKFLELEASLSRIQSILISAGNQLVVELSELKLASQQWNARQDKLLGAVGNVLHTIDRTTATISKMTKASVPLSVYSDISLESIIVRSGERELVRVTAQDLHSKLTTEQKQRLLSLERSVAFNYEVYVKSNSQYPGESDPDARVQLKAIMEQALGHMCSDWKDLLECVDFGSQMLIQAYARHLELCETSRGIVH